MDSSLLTSKTLIHHHKKKSPTDNIQLQCSQERQLNAKSFQHKPVYEKSYYNDIGGYGSNWTTNRMTLCAPASELCLNTAL